MADTLPPAEAPRQPTLFDAAGAREAAREAMQRVHEHASPRWLAHAHAAVVAAVEAKAEITTDDVWQRLWEWGVDPPREERALGPVMRQAVTSGLLRNTGRTQKSKRPICHGRPLTVWARRGDAHA